MRKNLGLVLYDNARMRTETLSAPVFFLLLLLPVRINPSSCTESGALHADVQHALIISWLQVVQKMRMSPNEIDGEIVPRHTCVIFTSWFHGGAKCDRV